MENMKRKCIAKEATNVGYIQRTWCLFLMVFTLANVIGLVVLLTFVMLF